MSAVASGTTTGSATAVAEATGDPVHPHVPASGPAAAHWYPAAGLLHRGTVVLLPGRGEHPGVYERFGRRLASDAYVVHVLDVPQDRTPEQVAAAVDAIAAGAATPLVLAGSDTGALHALTAAGRTAVRPDALLLAGAPQRETAAGPGRRPDRADADLDAEIDADVDATGWDDELSARTACPTHQGRLGADPLFVAGALSAPVPAALTASADAALAAGLPLPALVLHGAADQVSAPYTARVLAARLPAATLATVGDGRHDVLNDIQHRSVAALVVQWLERLRIAPELPPILTVSPPDRP